MCVGVCARARACVCGVGWGAGVERCNTGLTCQLRRLPAWRGDTARHGREQAGQQRHAVKASQPWSTCCACLHSQPCRTVAHMKKLPVRHRQAAHDALEEPVLQ